LLLAALRRLLILVAVVATITAAVSLLLGVLVGASAERSMALGFYAIGCFLMLAGFFVGNRGPARVKSESAGSGILPFFMFGGQRNLRWASLGEQTEAMNNSAVFITLGVILVLMGVALDTRHSFF
jgi:type IV secretory pathway protease TraF